MKVRRCFKSRHFEKSNRSFAKLPQFEKRRNEMQHRRFQDLEIPHPLSFLQLLVFCSGKISRRKRQAPSSPLPQKEQKDPFVDPSREIFFNRINLPVKFFSILRFNEWVSTSVYCKLSGGKGITRRYFSRDVDDTSSPWLPPSWNEMRAVAYNRKRQKQ